MSEAFCQLRKVREMTLKELNHEQRLQLKQRILMDRMEEKVKAHLGANLPTPTLSFPMRSWRLSLAGRSSFPTISRETLREVAVLRKVDV